MPAEEPPKSFSVLGWLYDKSPRWVQQLCHGPTLFWFPWEVEEYKIRLVGFQVIVINLIAVLILNMREKHCDACHLRGRWVVTAIAIDFFIRFFAGGRYSILGLIAEIVWLPFELFLKWRKWVPGPQKQFAAFVGFCFQSTAMIILWAHDGRITRAVASLVLLMLCFAAALEAFLGFCMACWMMKLAMKFKIFPLGVFQRCDSTYDETVAQHDEDITYYREGKMKRGHIGADKYRLAVKAATDNQLREDFNPLKHTHLDYFGMPLALMACAVAMRIADNGSYLQKRIAPNAETLSTSDPLWVFYIIIAWVVFAIFLFFYLLRLGIYRRNRLRKDIDHFIRGNFFSVLPIMFMMSAYLIRSVDDDEADEDYMRRMARVIFWLGAAVQFVLAVYWPARWIKIAMHKSTLNGTYMIPVVGTVIASIVAPAIDDTYYEVAWMWLAWGTFMFVVLFTLMFQQRLYSSNARDKLLMTDMVWLAAAAVLSIAWQSVSCVSQLQAGAAQCVLSDGGRFWYFVMFGLLWVQLLLFWPLKFYARHKFGMEYWVVLFTAAACSAATTNYFIFEQSDLARAMAFIGVILTNYLALHFTLAFVILVARRRIFTPEEKWGPLSFMKGVHYALRGCLPKFQKLANRLDPSDKESMEKFFEMVDMIHLVHKEHSHQEDRIYFPMLNSFMPGCVVASKDEHKRDRVFFKNMQSIKDTLYDDSQPDDAKKLAMQNLEDDVKAFAINMVEHLDQEELKLQPVPRKFLNNKLQKNLMKEMFLYTDWEAWRRIMPWVFDNIVLHRQRVRALKSLEMSVPEHMQQIGIFLYEGMTFTQFQRLAMDVPSIVPRWTYDNEYNRYW